MSTQPDVLFEPFAVKSLTLKNRIVMAPMTRSFARGGLPSDPHVAYYRRRAEGQVGLILSEGTVIERPHARNDPGVPFFHGQALDGWKQVIDAVHAAGSAMGPQLWHTGSIKSLTADWDRDGPAESPSGLIRPGQAHGVAMSEEDIADSVAAWARAAADAQRLGYDTIEVHGAHGYLVDQFFWSGTNERADRYGGASVAERSRSSRPLRIIRATRSARVERSIPVARTRSLWVRPSEAPAAARTANWRWVSPSVPAASAW